MIVVFLIWPGPWGFLRKTLRIRRSNPLSPTSSQIGPFFFSVWFARMTPETQQQLGVASPHLPYEIFRTSGCRRRRSTRGIRSVLSYSGQFQVQVCLVTERAISWQVHLSLVLKAFGSLTSLMSWEWANRNAANRHLELPGYLVTCWSLFQTSLSVYSSRFLPRAFLVEAYVLVSF